ncbi:MAG: hypothetical protein ACE5I0_01330 [Candidatus Binatia bacterium]
MKERDLEGLTISGVSALVFQVAHAYERTAKWYIRTPDLSEIRA